MHYIIILQDILISYIKKFILYAGVGILIYGAVSYNSVEDVKPRLIGNVNHHNSAEFIDLNERDITCIAETVYGEARGESKKGQLMVVNVIMNRVLSDKFPDNICEVVMQKKQFSAWNNGRISIIHKTLYNDIYSDIIDLFKDYYDLTDGSTWYHADYVNPKWSLELKRMAQVGKHIFYKDKEG